MHLYTVKLIEEQVNELTKTQCFIYMPDLNQFQTLKNRPDLISSLSYDIETSNAFSTNIKKYGLAAGGCGMAIGVTGISGVACELLAPGITKTMDLVHKLVSPSKKQSKKHLSLQDKEKILSDIETVLASKKNEYAFSNVLKNIMLEKNFTMAKLAQEANVDYSYLNKLMNNKLPENSIRKDYIIKLAFAMHLNVIETGLLLEPAGYILFGAGERETFLMVCLEHGVPLDEVNELLEDKGFKKL